MQVDLSFSRENTFFSSSQCPGLSTHVGPLFIGQSGGHPQLNATGQLQAQSIEDGDDCLRIQSPEKTKQFTDICSIVETKNEEFTALLHIGVGHR